MVHFLIAGAALFAAHAWLDDDASDAQDGSRRMRVTAMEVDWLKATWERQWQRPPTEDELRGLIASFLKEHLLAREAREMGLDEDDTVVRRRLAQKMSFLVEDTARLADPTEDELRQFYNAHPELFETSARVSFTHVYFSRERRRDAHTDARMALAELSRTDQAVDSSALGDSLLIDPELRDVDEPSVAGYFGPEFARAVFALQPGAWRGPFESGYGLHLVHVTNTIPAARREFAEVKIEVAERWRGQRQREEAAAHLAALVRKYDVTFDAGVEPLIGPLAAGGESR